MQRGDSDVARCAAVPVRAGEAGWTAWTAGGGNKGSISICRVPTAPTVYRFCTLNLHVESSLRTTRSRLELRQALATNRTTGARAAFEERRLLGEARRMPIEQADDGGSAWTFASHPMYVSCGDF